MVGLEIVSLLLLLIKFTTGFIGRIWRFMRKHAGNLFEAQLNARSLHTVIKLSYRRACTAPQTTQTAHAYILCYERA